MAVTETIQELLQGIDSAQYGRDMRQFIHKAIQKCYEEGSAGETDLEARDRLDDVEADITEIRSEMVTNFPSVSLTISDDRLLRISLDGQDNITSASAVNPSTVVTANGEVFFGVVIGDYNVSKLSKILFNAEYKKINGTAVSVSNDLVFEYKKVQNYGPSNLAYLVFKATNTTSSSITLGRGVNNRIVADAVFAFFGT